MAIPRIGFVNLNHEQPEFLDLDRSLRTICLLAWRLTSGASKFSIGSLRMISPRKDVGKEMWSSVSG